VTIDSAYKRVRKAAKAAAEAAEIRGAFKECAWGDGLGIQFEGLSLPDPPSPDQLRREEEDFARWSFLFADPLFELNQLTIRDPKQPILAKPPPGKKAAWEELWTTISMYKPSEELRQLLRRGGLDDLWPQAWSNVTSHSTTPKLAFERSAHEIVEATNALARSVVAEIYCAANAAGRSGPNRALRQQLVERLLADWKQQVYAVGSFLAGLFKRAATRMLRTHRNDFCEKVSLPMGDIFLYLSRGDEIRDYIRGKIIDSNPPVTVIAHSLGGIASFDLLAGADAPEVARLVTVGSQSPLMYEIGALPSLKRPTCLPAKFPPWLNIYDRDDFLSFSAKRLFPGVDDFDAELGQPFPDSHSAYFDSERVWNKIRSVGVA